MGMTILKCRQCGGDMKYTEGQTRLVCEYCGTEYTLQNEKPNIQYLFYNDPHNPFYRTFVPEGFNASTFDETERIGSILSPLCVAVNMNAPDGTNIVFSPYTYYKDFSQGGLNLKKDYMLSPMTMVRQRHFSLMDDYAKERVLEMFPGANVVSVQKINDSDEFLSAKASQFANEASSQLKAQTKAMFGKYLMVLEAGGERFSALFAAVIAGKENVYKKFSEPAPKPAQPKQPQQTKSGGGFLKDLINFGMQGGILGSGTAPDFLKNIQMPDLSGLANPFSVGMDWGKGFDLLLLKRGDMTTGDNANFGKVLTTINYENAYYAASTAERQNVERIMVQGMQQRTQNAINSSQRISQTLSQTSDIVMQGYEERSRIMDNMSRRSSEAIRGVNTYTDTYGRDFQAGVQYDHVYQKGSDFVGVVDGSLNLGPDWTELKKKD